MDDRTDPLDEPTTLLRPQPRPTWRERAEHLADATGTTPVRLLVGAGALAAAVALALALTRPPAPPPEVTLPFASSTSVASTSTTAPAEILVHVAGAVRHPGVHRLATGARVIDAVEAAGGLADTADGSRLNLAAPVADGERVYVPAVGEEVPPPVPGSTAEPGPGGTARAALVDLNRADEAALDALPGIGPATAAAIIEHRERIGGFTSVDQLLDVRGIGESKLEELRPLVTV